MLSNLADPDGPAPGDRGAVTARAGQIRRRRRAAAGGAVAAVALLTVTAVLLPSTGSAREDELVVATRSPAVSPTAAPSPTASPTPSPSVSPPPAPSRVPTVSPPTRRSAAPPTARATAPATAPATDPNPPSPSPAATNPLAALDRPDGTPGWSTGFTSCTSFAEQPRPAVPAQDGLRIDVDAPASAVPGEPFTARWTLTNTSSEPLREQLIAPEAGWLLRAGTRVAHDGDDTAELLDISLEPGASTTGTVRVSASDCADTSRQQAPALPPGSYEVVVDFRSAANDYARRWSGTSPPLRLGR